jgi:LysM repeat protein
MQKALVSSSLRHALKEVLPVLLLLSLPLFARAGFFSLFTSISERAPLTEEESSARNVAEIDLLRAATNHNPQPIAGGGDISVDGFALVADSGPTSGDNAVKAKEQNGEISTYIVREGDSISTIAEMFHVSVNTILWANNISKGETIKPNDELVILPITGVSHIVKEGDTLESIAKKYTAEVSEITAYNQIVGNDDLVVGDTIVVPGGEKVVPKPTTPKGTTPAPVRTQFIHPLPGSIRTQGIHGYNGVDLAAPQGTPVRASAAGVVIISRNAGWNGGYGQYVVIKHPNGSQTLYAHLSVNSVATGATVAQGQRIGSVGNTGRSTGDHLHFEVRGAKNPF